MKNILSSYGVQRVAAIDLETIIHKQSDFLRNERIIAFSVSYWADSEVKTKLYVSRDDSKEEETRILLEAGNFIVSLEPMIIIGYNHTGYDVPLLQMKFMDHNVFQKFYLLKYFIGTSYILDMMYVIADYLYAYDGDYKIRKLSEVVNHEAFAELPLDRKKNLVIREDKNIGEVIEELWRSGSPDFIDYITGDTHDLMQIFLKIFQSRRPHNSESD